MPGTEVAHLETDIPPHYTYSITKMYFPSGKEVTCNKQSTFNRRTSLVSLQCDPQEGVYKQATTHPIVYVAWHRRLRSLLAAVFTHQHGMKSNNPISDAKRRACSSSTTAHRSHQHLQPHSTVGLEDRSGVRGRQGI